MRNTILTVSLLACLFITACTDRPEDHILSDSKQRTTIKNELKAKQQLLPDGNLFDILKDKEISKKEKEALQFRFMFGRGLREQEAPDAHGRIHDVTGL